MLDGRRVGFACGAGAALCRSLEIRPLPARPDAPPAAKLGAAGFLIPLLLPLSFCLVVSYALRAERNLNHYLHDYD